MRHEESDSQQAVIGWFAYSHKVLGVKEHLLFACPNGGRRSAREASRLKREGVRAGVPDLILLVPKGKFHGLVLEMKSTVGVVRPSQKEFMADVGALGYLAVVAYNTEQAIAAITNYLRQ